MQNRILKPLMQEIGDNTDHNPAQYTHFEGLDPQHHRLSDLLHHRRVGKLVGDGQVIVDTHVHQHIADKPAKAPTALLRFASPNGMAMANITGR